MNIFLKYIFKNIDVYEENLNEELQNRAKKEKKAQQK